MTQDVFLQLIVGSESIVEPWHVYRSSHTWDLQIFSLSVNSLLVIFVDIVSGVVDIMSSNSNVQLILYSVASDSQ